MGGQLVMTGRNDYKKTQGGKLPLGARLIVFGV